MPMHSSPSQKYKSIFQLLPFSLFPMALLWGLLHSFTSHRSWKRFLLLLRRLLAHLVQDFPLPQTLPLKFSFCTNFPEMLTKFPHSFSRAHLSSHFGSLNPVQARSFGPLHSTGERFSFSTHSGAITSQHKPKSCPNPNFSIEFSAPTRTLRPPQTVLDGDAPDKLTNDTRHNPERRT